LNQNQEAELFKFRWCRQSEFKNQLKLTSKMLTRMPHMTNINLFNSTILEFNLVNKPTASSYLGAPGV
jgi:hypothetical protein